MSKPDDKPNQDEPTLTPENAETPVTEDAAQGEDAPEATNAEDLDLSTDNISTEIEQLNEKIDALSAKVLRERADNDNLRKRQERELANAYKYATEKLIKDVIPIIDSLMLGIESAQKSDSENATLTQFIEGSEMTLKLLVDTLARHGVTEINPEGEKFNPELHEAVSILPNADVEPNNVLHVAQKGYSLNGRVVRAAQVVVAKAP